MTPAAIEAVLLAYFLAGIPIGLLVGRAKGIPDIRECGSGNIGASNVLRVIGVKAGLFVWAMDCLKGVAPVLLARHAFGLEGLALGLTGAAATAGHCFSPYLRFTGGRGVSTGLGVILGLYWPAGVCALSVFVALVAGTRYISLSSMAGASSAPLWLLVWMLPVEHLAQFAFPYAVGAAVGAAIVVFRHFPNIQRLLAGTERKIGQKETTTEEPAAQDEQGDGPDE